MCLYVALTENIFLFIHADSYMTCLLFTFMCFSSCKTRCPPERRWIELSWVESNQKIFNKVCCLISILFFLLVYASLGRSGVQWKIKIFWIVTQTGVKTSHDGMIFRIQLCCSKGLFMKRDDEPEIESVRTVYGCVLRGTEETCHTLGDYYHFAIVFGH